MDVVQKMGKVEAISLFIVIMTNFVIFNAPSVILQTSGSASWLNIIYIAFIGLGIVFLITKLFKKFPNHDIVDISKFVGGSFFSTVVSICYILFFIFISTISLSYFTNGLKVIYFTLSPVPFILLFLIIPPLIANHYGLKSIAGVNRIFIPVILIGLFIILFSSFSDFTLERFFPVLGFGINETFGYGITNIFAFTGLIYIYFLPPFLKEHSDFKFVCIFSTIISFLFLLISVVSLLLSFSAITNTDELFSIYLLTRMINLGKIFQRVDAIFILLWILAFFSYLSVNFFIILHLFKKTCKLKSSNGVIYALAAIIFGICLFWKDIAIIKFLYRVVFKYLFLFFSVFFNIVILIIANIKKKKAWRIK